MKSYKRKNKIWPCEMHFRIVSKWLGWMPTTDETFVQCRYICVNMLLCLFNKKLNFEKFLLLSDVLFYASSEEWFNITIYGCNLLRCSVRPFCHFKHLNLLNLLKKKHKNVTLHVCSLWPFNCHYKTLFTTVTFFLFVTFNLNSFWPIF